MGFKVLSSNVRAQNGRANFGLWPVAKT